MKKCHGLKQNTGKKKKELVSRIYKLLYKFNNKKASNSIKHKKYLNTYSIPKYGWQISPSNVPHVH